MTNLKVTLEIISPELAREYLASLPGLQRNVRKGHVEKMAKDMRSGRFDVTGDAIRFDKNGNLIDGQHRLNACVEAGVEFTTFVIRGLDPEVYEHIDDGIKRSVRDHVKWAGVPNPKDVSAIAGAFARVVGGGESRHQMVRFVQDHNAVLQSLVPIAHALKHKGWKTTPSNFVSGLLFLCLRGGCKVSEVAKFAERVVDGSSLCASDPRWLLRERLMTAKAGLTPDGVARNTAALVVAAWNAHVSGAKLKRLHVRHKNERGVYAVPAVKGGNGKCLSRTNTL